jgi:hypothetical protein
MPPVVELIGQAHAAGVTVSREADGTLRIRAPRRAADLARAVREREAEVLALLPPAHRCGCGSTAGVRLYISGWRCPLHTPAALAGHPEPDTHHTPEHPARRTFPQSLGPCAWPTDQTGPCARCRRLCHRYGQGGNPLCTDCRSSAAEA